MSTPQDNRATRNRTITLTQQQKELYRSRLLKIDGYVGLPNMLNRTICQDTFEVLDWMPSQCIDLVFADPPYNLHKSFNGNTFKKMNSSEYAMWLEMWLPKVARILKPTGSIYICGDWRSSGAIQSVAEKLFIVQNRITWEREKGRGAAHNWKNCSEDIWFCTMSNSYTFNIGDVKLKRRVIAPYTDKKGDPKDWDESLDGRFRITFPSNIWTDLTVPFWSMAENTEHPTQKPEKLLAKIILASSNEEDVIFDPFLGSGTTSVVAKKLKRRYIGVEADELYCCIAEHRLSLAENSTTIQGYYDGVFWERNSLNEQKKAAIPSARTEQTHQATFSLQLDREAEL